ncbi:MAG: biopolymer transporter ExbD [Planctomycetes bacterium]|nr:biopolymer transporter ExbD [Planctomycetota bacterium]NUQ35444.1 biopolymer transporter ExbD [Planctomycetaceae bacterium]
MIRKRRKEQQPISDLTPMIDVTFQLLIFFVVAMKIKREERRVIVELPQDQGAPITPAEPKDFIAVRLFWKNNQMIYEVDVRTGSSQGTGKYAIQAGSLETLIFQAAAPGHGAYRRVFDELLMRVEACAAKMKTANRVEISMSLDPTRSSGEQIAGTAPWGFVTLALDALSQFNEKRRMNGLEPLPVAFKNTEPDGSSSTRRVGSR